MKKITVKVITISSQLLVVSLFLLLLFSGKGNNDKEVIVSNNNFDKMADSTSILFKKEEMLTNVPDNNVTVELSDDSSKKEEEEKVEIPEEDTEPVQASDDKPVVDLFYDRPVIGDAYYGKITGYGPDCYGCTSGCTRTGHNLYNSIYYEDSEYGSVRILAADASFGKYAIFRVSDVPGMDPFIGIVLDTGGNVGFNKGTLFDLAFATEKDPSVHGISTSNNVKFELLREGVSW